MQHLTNALMLASPRQSTQKSAPNQAAVNKWRRSHAQAAGEALAFLLHDGTAQLPLALRDEALGILKQCGVQLAQPMALPPSSGSLDSKVRAQQRDFAEPSKARASLKELVGLIGLAPVKSALCDLADQVRCVAAFA